MIEEEKQSVVANELIEIIAGHYISLEEGVSVIAQLIEFYSAYHTIPESTICSMVIKEVKGGE